MNRLSFRQLFLTALSVSIASGLAFAGPPQDDLHRGYYLEQVKRDKTAAAEAYQAVIKSRNADKHLKDEARKRLAGLREDLRAADLASLMPSGSLAYVEFKQPGDQILKLLEQLGLLASDPPPTANGAPRVAVSPQLIRELIGIGGAAVAVTGFDPVQGEPMGVAVLHPGDMDLVRGLIETGLPVGGQPVDPIGGFPTYDVEGKVLITLTSRLVVASPHRAEIKGVVDRLTGKAAGSLADNDDLRHVLDDRDDSLLFFCVNAKPILPMIEVMTASMAHNPEVAMAKTLLDPASLRSFSGKLGVADDGLSLTLALRLAEDHQNLVYNFLRMPSIERATLKSIPHGAAGFVAASLNPSDSRFSAVTDGHDEAIVTAMDFGRELFGNIATIGMFILPPDENHAPQAPMPDAGLVVTVNDPSKSEALWTQMLGLASLATGTGAVADSSEEIGGVAVRRYRFPEQVTVRVAFDEHNMIVGSSKRAVSAALDAKRNGRSVLTDKGFSGALQSISDDTTKAVVIHPGRCAAVARQFMSPQEAKELAPIVGVLDQTVASLVINHSNDELRFAINVAGIPDIGPLVSQMILKEKQHGKLHNELAKAMREGDWNKAQHSIEQSLAIDPDHLSTLTKQFHVHAAGLGDEHAALNVAERIFVVAHNDATALNNFAWRLLTESEYGDAYYAMALKFSRRSNDLSDQGSWVFLDTLALAEFENGNFKEAVRLQTRAIELSNGQAAEELNGRLAQFEEAAETGMKVARKTSAQE